MPGARSAPPSLVDPVVDSTTRASSSRLRARLSLVLVAALGAALAVQLSVSPASADSRTKFMIDQLKTSDDYRVRVQAAAGLGVSNDDAAVKPLCDALTADSNVAVRAAVAAALGKLGKPAGLPCLQAAEAKESAPAVKSTIQASIATLKGGAVPAPPPPSASSKYYVAIDVTNKTKRPNDEVDALVRAAIQAKLVAKPAFAVAPKGETVAKGKEIVTQKKLKGFYLIATVEPPQYAGGNLTQVVRVSMWTYPDKALQGEFTPKLTQSGTPGPDVPSENVLIKMCAETASESFAKVALSM